ncbi:hypothetical protein OAA41_00575 [bacterium]|nr:hypothetical protein [bacterium]
MAGNFYYRQSKVTEDDIYTNSRLRDNAFVTIIGKDFKLPADTSGMSSTYNPEGTGRAAPVLKDVKISLEGEAASLRRVEVAFTCFDMKSFEKAEKALLIPGSEVTIKYGYVGPVRSNQSAEYTFRVYDYSFSITKENYFECKFKAVAKGTGAEFDYIDISGTDRFAKQGLRFITDYDGFDTKSDVLNMFDYIDYQVQVGTGKDIESAKKLGTFEASAFDPESGTCGKMTDGGHFGVLKAPKKYSPNNKIDAGVGEDDMIVYITLEALVSIVNKYVLSDNENNYQIKFDSAYSAIDINFPAGRVWSPSPYKTLFPYIKDTPENSYKPRRIGDYTVNPDSYITCDSFAEFNAEIYEEFRLDKNILPVGIAAANNVTPGSPRGILLTRDVLREIQSSFDSKAISEDQSTEETEKADSKVDLASFFKKIFAVIRDNSGGDWDLTLDVDEEASDGTIWIVNKQSPVKETVKPLVLSPTAGVNGVRELKLSGQVPKDIQAEAFGGSPDVTPKRTAAAIIAANAQVLAEAQFKYDKTLSELKDKLPKAQTKLNDSYYSTDATTAAKGVINQLVKTLPPDGLAERCKLMEPTPFPLSVEIAVDGIEGFSFGDTITSDYLPTRYRLEKGAHVVFTVTKYTHTIKGNDWQTDLTCVSRIVKDD